LKGVEKLLTRARAKKGITWPFSKQVVNGEMKDKIPENLVTGRKITFLPYYLRGRRFHYFVLLVKSDIRYVPRKVAKVALELALEIAEKIVGRRYEQYVLTPEGVELWFAMKPNELNELLKRRDGRRPNSKKRSLYLDLRQFHSLTPGQKEQVALSNPRTKKVYMKDGKLTVEIELRKWTMEPGSVVVPGLVKDVRIDLQTVKRYASMSYEEIAKERGIDLEKFRYIPSDKLRQDRIELISSKDILALLGKFDPPSPDEKTITYTKILQEELRKADLIKEYFAKGRPVAYGRYHTVAVGLYRESSIDMLVPYAIQKVVGDEYASPWSGSAYVEGIGNTYVSKVNRLRWWDHNSLRSVGGIDAFALFYRPQRYEDYPDLKGFEYVAMRKILRLKTGGLTEEGFKVVEHIAEIIRQIQKYRYLEPRKHVNKKIDNIIRALRYIANILGAHEDGKDIISTRFLAKLMNVSNSTAWNILKLLKEAVIISFIDTKLVYSHETGKHEPVPIYYVLTNVDPFEQAFRLMKLVSVYIYEFMFHARLKRLYELSGVNYTVQLEHTPHLKQLAQKQLNLEQLISSPPEVKYYELRR